MIAAEGEFQNVYTYQLVGDCTRRIKTSLTNVRATVRAMRVTVRAMRASVRAIVLT